MRLIHEVFFSFCTRTWVDEYSFGVLFREIYSWEKPEPDTRDEQVAMVKNRTLIWSCLERAPEARPSREDDIGKLEQPMLD